MEYGITAVLVPCHQISHYPGEAAAEAAGRGQGAATTEQADVAQMSEGDRRLQMLQQALSRLACQGDLDMPSILSTCLVADAGDLETLPTPRLCDPEATEPQGMKLLLVAHQIDLTAESPVRTVKLVVQRELEVRATLLAHLRERGYLKASVVDRDFVPILVTAQVHGDPVQERDQHGRFNDAVGTLISWVDQAREADLFDADGPIQSAPGYKGPTRPDAASVVFSNPTQYLGPEGLNLFHLRLVQHGLLSQGMPLGELMAELDPRRAAKLEWGPAEPVDLDNVPAGARLK